jgi:hypothetical protein
VLVGEEGLGVCMKNLNPELYCSGDKIETNEIGKACSAYGGERHIQSFGGET